MEQITPRQFQVEPIERARAALKSVGRALVVMATGLGKTIVSAFAVKDLLKEGRGLFLCHLNAGLEQALTQFRDVLGNDARLGVFHGEKKHWEEVDILFASFQTLTDWKHAFFEDEFRFVIVDESHHGQAPTYKQVIKYFKPAELLALTATPERMDQKDIREIFGEPVVNIPLEEGIANGWLASVEYHVLTDNLNRQALQKIAENVLHKGKRISMKQLNETIFIEARDEKVAEIIMGYGNKKTFIFCENTRHADNFQKFIPQSRVYHSKIDSNTNRKTLEAFRLGSCRRILVVDKMNECIDVPDAELIVFLRCTDSKTVFLQQLGRGLRRTLEKGKVTVLDFVANAERVMMVREITERVRHYTPDWSELETDPHCVKGNSFNFVFADEQIELFKVLERIRKKFISEVPALLADYSSENALPADKVLAGTMRKIHWKCNKCGYKWEKTGDARSRGWGCAACANKVVTAWNNLSVTHPELAREYSPRNLLPATQIIAGTHKKLHWICSKCKYEWEASGDARSGRDASGCPACSNRAATPTNNLAVTHPELAKDYSSKNPLPATAVVAGSNAKFIWECHVCRHEWNAAACARSAKRYRTGCPACGNRVVTPTNNLAFLYPGLAKEYSPENAIPADQVVAGSARRAKWICATCGHKWQTKISMRTGPKTGCPKCRKRVKKPRKKTKL